MIGIESLSREFVRNTVGVVLSLQTVAIVYLWIDIRKQDNDKDKLRKEIVLCEQNCAEKRQEAARRETEIYKLAVERLEKIQDNLERKKNKR